MGLTPWAVCVPLASCEQVRPLRPTFLPGVTAAEHACTQYMVLFSEIPLVSLEVWASACPLWHVAEGPLVCCLGGLAMARGRKTSLTIRLTPAQRRTLLAWQRAPTMAAGRARRGQMILLLAEGMPITAIAATVGISRRFVYKWVQRFLEQGVAGLANTREGGHRRMASRPALTEAHAVRA
jgi:hypothetical protein